MNLYLDDMRDPPNNPLDWIVCRSFYEAVGYIHIHGLSLIKLISFDHDLGESYGRPQKTGYDFAVWLIELDNRNRFNQRSKNVFCSDFRFRLHSSNPVGRINICSLLDRYFEKTFEDTASRETTEVPPDTMWEGGIIR